MAQPQNTDPYGQPPMGEFIELLIWGAVVAAICAIIWGVVGNG